MNDDLHSLRDDLQQRRTATPIDLRASVAKHIAFLQRRIGELEAPPPVAPQKGYWEVFDVLAVQASDSETWSGETEFTTHIAAAWAAFGDGMPETDAIVRLYGPDGKVSSAVTIRGLSAARRARDLRSLRKQLANQQRLLADLERQ